MALRARKEASVELRVLVDSEGRVRRVELTGPPAGFGFDPAAREAALAGRYRPGTRAGVPVEMETTLVVRFRIDQQR
jgi:TonB family protein